MSASAWRRVSRPRRCGLREPSPRTGRHRHGSARSREDPRQAPRPRLRARPYDRDQSRGSVSAVDLALWDIVGKASGRTVAQLLGGHSDSADDLRHLRLSVPMTSDQLVELGRDLMAKGHKRLKMLVGVAKSASTRTPRGCAMSATRSATTSCSPSMPTKASRSTIRSRSPG